MKNLQLPLTKKWFDLTDVGGKREVYREVTPYWCNRFLQFNGGLNVSREYFDTMCFNVGFWDNERHNNYNESVKALICQINTTKRFVFKQFYLNVLTLGCPKSTDTDKIIKFEHEGIEIREGREEWGAEKEKLYFVIKHGKRLQ